MRLVVPDVITLDANYSAALGYGFSETYTLNLITRGKDAGLHTTNTQQHSYGAEWGFGANLGHLHYTGPVSGLTAETLNGPSRSFSAGLGAGGNATLGYQDWNASITNPTFIGYSAGVGVTIGASYSFGETASGLWPFNPSTSK